MRFYKNIYKTKRLTWREGGRAETEPHALVGFLVVFFLIHVICALGQAKKKPGTPLPSCAAAAAAAAGRARLGPGVRHTPWRTHTPRSTRRNERPPERRDEAATAGGFYSSFPSRKRKQTGTRRPPLPARELTPSRASQLPAQLPPLPRPTRCAQRRPRSRARRHTGCKLPLAELPALLPLPPPPEAAAPPPPLHPSQVPTRGRLAWLHF